MATTSDWTAYVAASVDLDPGGAPATTSAWSAWASTTTDTAPVTEWYVATGSGWQTAKMVALS